VVVFRHRYDVDDADARLPMPWRGVERSTGRVVTISKRSPHATLARATPSASLAHVLDVLERSDEVYVIEEAPPGVPLSAERREPKVQLGPWLALIDDLVRLHDAGVEHGGLDGDVIVRSGERFIVRGLHAGRPTHTSDVVGVGAALTRSLAPESFAAIDLHSLGSEHVEGRATLPQAAARMREALAKHARSIDLELALRAASPWQALRVLRDEGVLHDAQTALYIVRALGARLLAAFDERCTRTALDDVALLPLDDDLVVLAENTEARRGARVTALRVLERRRGGGAADALVRLLHDDDVVVAAAARRALARIDDAALRLVAGAFARCPHGWRTAMADGDTAGPRYCASCDARVVPATDGELLLDGEVAADQPILIIDGAEGRHRFAMVGDEVVIGRSPDTDIAIGHPDVALRHLKVRALDGRFWVEAFPGATFERVRGIDRPHFVVHDTVAFGGFTLSFDTLPGSRARDTDVQGPSGAASLVARTRALVLHAGTIGGTPYPLTNVGSGANAVLEDVTQPPSFARVVVLWAVERGIEAGIDDLDVVVLDERQPVRVNRLQIVLENSVVRVFDPDVVPNYVDEDDDDHYADPYNPFEEDSDDPPD
jgi:hypothetical protein